MSSTIQSSSAAIANAQEETLPARLSRLTKEKEYLEGAIHSSWIDSYTSGRAVQANGDTLTARLMRYQQVTNEIPAVRAAIGVAKENKRRACEKVQQLIANQVSTIQHVTWSGLYAHLRGPTRLTFDEWGTEAAEKYAEVKSLCCQLGTPLEQSWPPWPGATAMLYLEVHDPSLGTEERLSMITTRYHDVEQQLD